MRIFISTGEVSGDLQGSMLIDALKRQAANLGLPLEIVALGGDKMAASGATLLGNTSSVGSIGLVEVLPYVFSTIQIQRQAIAYLKKNPPDLVIMIDYVAPNTSIGKYLKRHMPNVPRIYYIAPQEWVWSFGDKKTKSIVDITDKLLAIFPEEARYYEDKGVKVTWVGHPLIDRAQHAPSRQEARAKLGITDDEIAIALLPASRFQEIKYLLPIMLEAALSIQEKLPKAKFWIPLSLEIYREAITKKIQDFGLQATVVSGKNQEVIAASDLAITKSGTVNLELALLNIPQVVLYRVSPFTAWVAKNILKLSIPFASPANLVLMREIVPEFIQYTATSENITQASMELLLNPERKQQMLADYAQMRQELGEVGVCDRVAGEIFEVAKVCN